MKCEVCGASDASKTVEVEGSEMKVCDECSSLGKLKSKPSKAKRKPKKKKDFKAPSWTISGSDEVLKRGYGKIVKRARENADLTMKQLAEKVSEKQSVIRRIENEDLKPAGDLSDKIEKELDIELFEELDTDSEKFTSEDEESLTIGDVAKVK